MENFDDDESDGIVLKPELPKRPKYCPPSQKILLQVLNGPDEGFFENFRMDKQLFYTLLNILLEKDLIRPTMELTQAAQLALFLYIASRDPNDDLSELLQYSEFAIDRSFNAVLNAIIENSSDWFETDPPPPDVPQEISNDSRFFPFFKDCIGFVDALQIPVFVAENDGDCFDNKIEDLRENMLAVCTFDLKFRLIFAGWKGTTVDIEGLSSDVTKLQVPEGKYYLVGDKYENMPSFVAPYPGAVYWSGDRPADSSIQTLRQLFNQRHWDLRRANKVIMKILTERFPILMSTLYPAETKVKLVVACCALHNFIRKMRPDDAIFRKHEGVSEASPEAEGGFPDEDYLLMEANGELYSEQRDTIASTLWCDFVSKR